MKDDPTGKIPSQIIASIKSSGNIALFTHIHPDGDALGSLFALADILRSLGKEVFCYLEEPVSHLYDFLPQCEKAQTSLADYRNFIEGAGQDLLAVGLDCGDDDRLGVDKAEFLGIEPFIVIDHHQSHRNFGTLRWVDSSRSSTGEMVYELGIALDASLSFDAAYNIYVAICTDTGSFRYESTQARTMQIAGELLGRGVKPAEVGRHLYDNYSKERLKLLEMVLSSIELVEADQIAFMKVTSAMLVESGASIQDIEGFIDFPRSLSTVKVAVLLKETVDGTVGISLRAKGDCDVAEVAKLFKGGGHRNAAGFRCSDKNISQIRDDVHAAICRLLV